MGHANARDLLALKQSLNALPEVKQLLEKFEAKLFNLAIHVPALDDLAKMIGAAIREDAPPTIMTAG